MLQAFVRDPDGYYIEFCNCQLLENYLHKKMEEETKKFNISTTLSFLNMGKKLKKIAEDSKTNSQKFNKESTQKVKYPNSMEEKQGSYLGYSHVPNSTCDMFSFLAKKIGNTT